jgi:hypothetical protein
MQLAFLSSFHVPQYRLVGLSNQFRSSLGPGPFGSPALLRPHPRVARAKYMMGRRAGLRQGGVCDGAKQRHGQEGWCNGRRCPHRHRHACAHRLVVARDHAGHRLRSGRRALVEGGSRPGDRCPGAVFGHPVGGFRVAAHRHPLETGWSVRAGRGGAGYSGQGDSEGLSPM